MFCEVFGYVLGKCWRCLGEVLEIQISGVPGPARRAGLDSSLGIRKSAPGKFDVTDQWSLLSVLLVAC